jgi:hypothetical protein
LNDQAELEATRSQYLDGVADTTTVNSDLWELDQRYLDVPGRDQVMLDLLYDYQNNVTLYSRIPAGTSICAPTSRRRCLHGPEGPVLPSRRRPSVPHDLPDAELHLLDTGHFATATHTDEIENWWPLSSTNTSCTTAVAGREPHSGDEELRATNRNHPQRPAALGVAVTQKGRRMNVTITTAIKEGSMVNITSGADNGADINIGRHGVKRVPVAAAIVSASAIREAAAAKSPRQVVRMASAFTEITIWASKPTSRQNWSWRAAIVCQRSSSHTILAAMTARKPHRRLSSTVISSSAKTRAARRSTVPPRRVPR